MSRGERLALTLLCSPVGSPVLVRRLAREMLALRRLLRGGTGAPDYPGVAGHADRLISIRKADSTKRRKVQILHEWADASRCSGCGTLTGDDFTLQTGLHSSSQKKSAKQGSKQRIEILTVEVTPWPVATELVNQHAFLECKFVIKRFFYLKTHCLKTKMFATFDSFCLEP
ncbi:hypothetical protein ISCGN_013472 [Ixodes scapularis]